MNTTTAPNAHAHLDQIPAAMALDMSRLDRYDDAELLRIIEGRRALARKAHRAGEETIWYSRSTFTAMQVARGRGLAIPPPA